MGLSTKCLKPYKMKINGIPKEFRCNQCYACNEHKYYDLLFRSIAEYKEAKAGVFLTLTQSEENESWKESYDPETGEVTYVPTLVKADFDKFRKAITMRHNRAMKKEQKSNWPKLKWVGNGEYGPTTLRPHYHAFILNLHPSITNKSIEQTWTRGFIKAGSLNGEAAIKYILKDMVKQKEIKRNLLQGMEMPFQKWSNGLGESFIQKYGNSIHKEEATINGKQGVKIGLGKYLKSKAEQYGYIKQENLNESEMVEKYYQEKEENEQRTIELQEESFRRFGTYSIEEAQNRMQEIKERRRKFFGKKTL